MSISKCIVRLKDATITEHSGEVYAESVQGTTAGGELHLQCQVRVLYTFLLWQMQHNRRRPTLSSSVTFSTRVPLGLPWKT